MKSHTNKILESIKQALTVLLPKGGKALLFGSQARGMHGLILIGIF